MPAASATDVRTSSSERPARATSARSWLSSAADWRNDTSAAALAVRSSSPAGSAPSAPPAAASASMARRAARTARSVPAASAVATSSWARSACTADGESIWWASSNSPSTTRPSSWQRSDRPSMPLWTMPASWSEPSAAQHWSSSSSSTRSGGRDASVCPSIRKATTPSPVSLVPAATTGVTGAPRAVGQQQQEGVVLDPLARVQDEPSAAVAVPEEPPQEHGELVVPLVAAHHPDADAVPARGDGFVHPLGPRVVGLGDGAEVGEVGLDVAGGHRAHRRPERVADQRRDREAEEHAERFR